MSDPFKNFTKAADLPPVVLLAGDEDYLMERYTRHLSEVGVPKDMRDFNFDTLYCPESGAKRIIEIARSFPMMAEKRVLVVKDIQKLPAADVTALASYSQQANPSTCMILLYRSGDLRHKVVRDLRKHVYIIECKKLYENQALAWLETELGDRGRKVERDAVSLLLMQVGTNLRDLMNEVEKLLLFVDEDKPITATEVAAVAGFRKEYTIFSLQNAIGERDLKQAFEIYDRIRHGTPLQVMLFQIAKYLTNLLIAKGFSAGPNDGELAKLTKTHPYFVKELHRHKRMYSDSELENALENVRQVDYISKTYPVQEAFIVQQLFTHIMRGFSAQRLPFSPKK